MTCGQILGIAYTCCYFLLIPQTRIGHINVTCRHTAKNALLLLLGRGIFCVVHVMPKDNRLLVISTTFFFYIFLFSPTDTLVTLKQKKQKQFRLLKRVHLGDRVMDCSDLECYTPLEWKVFLIRSSISGMSLLQVTHVEKLYVSSCLLILYSVTCYEGCNLFSSSWISWQRWREPSRVSSTIELIRSVVKWEDIQTKNYYIVRKK
jgi:hypothetical protein